MRLAVTIDGVGRRRWSRTTAATATAAGAVQRCGARRPRRLTGGGEFEFAAVDLHIGTQRSVVDDTCDAIGAVLSQTRPPAPWSRAEPR